MCIDEEVSVNNIVRAWEKQVLLSVEEFTVKINKRTEVGLRPVILLKQEKTEKEEVQ